MNAGWIQHTGGDFLFYHEGFTDAVGRVTAAVDAERMAVAKALGVPATTFLDVVLRGRTHHQGGARQRRYRARLPGERAEQDHQVAVLARSPLRPRGRRLRPRSDGGARAACRRRDADHRRADRSSPALAVGIDYARDGLTLEKLGLAGKSPAELLQFVERRRLTGTANGTRGSRASCASAMRQAGLRRAGRVLAGQRHLYGGLPGAEPRQQSLPPHHHDPRRRHASRRRSWSMSRRTWPGSARASPTSAPTTSSPRIRRTCSPTRCSKPASASGPHRDRARLHAGAGLHPARASGCRNATFVPVPRPLLRRPHDQDRRRRSRSSRRSARSPIASSARCCARSGRA